jgi:hypothetical protein
VGDEGEQAADQPGALVLPADRVRVTRRRRSSSDRSLSFGHWPTSTQGTIDLPSKLVEPIRWGRKPFDLRSWR